MNTKTRTRITTVRMPAEMVEALDSLAAAEALRIGLPVDRSALVRRALAQTLQRSAPADLPAPLGLATNLIPTT